MGVKSLDAARPASQVPASSSWLHRSRADLLLALPFIAFFLLQLAHHQMWRDETNPWALAVNSRSLGQLFYFARNEAHPYLWYLLLWVVSRASVSLVVLKCLAAFVGTCTYLLIALRSPFSRLEKVLLFCSYYISFEYAVFARMYGLMLLLVVLYLCSRTSQPYKVVRNAVWLGLIANADTYGVLLTFALVAEYTWFLGSDRAWWKRQWRKQVLPAFTIYVVFLAVSFASLIPTKHVSLDTSKGGPLAHVRSRIFLSQAVRGAMIDSWYPLDPEAPKQYWNVTHLRHVTDVFLGLVILAIGLQFRHEKRLLFTLAFYGLTLILFMYLVYMGYSRHYGTMFVAFLAALWIQRSQEANLPNSQSISSRFAPAAPRFALLPLGVCAWAGVVVAYASWTHPFSQAGAAAQWLRTNQYDRVLLVGTPDFAAANVAEHLGRPMYFLECGCTDTFMQFWDRRDHFSEKEIPSRLAQAFTQAHQPFLIYVGARPLTEDQLRAIASHSIAVTPLAQFTGAEEDLENFFLYKIGASAPES